MAQTCDECHAARAVGTIVTGRPVCRRCGDRLAGAAAGTILGGPAQGIATGTAAGAMSGMSTAFPPKDPPPGEGFWQRWRRRIIG